MEESIRHFYQIDLFGDTKLLRGKLKYSFIKALLALTSVADGGPTPWFLSELHAAEPSAVKSAHDHQHLCFHAPGTQQHIYSHTNAASQSFTLFYLKNIKSCTQF